MKRIITANDEHDRSYVLIEEEVGGNGAIWETRPGQPFGAKPEPGAHDLDFAEGQTIARMIEIPPDAVMAEVLRRGVPGLDENGFHRTGTLDFVVLLEGSLTLELDEGEVRLSPGDVVVQRDTNHAWRAGDAPARMLCIVQKPGARS
ncbi:cupin domain-containing protein [Sphingobium aromaticivastans]|uniref:cupin domain-containing protein n=1 Tax=Sphingobium aromaticivastans TaxID=1778665 RepID=UPI00301A1AC2